MQQKNEKEICIIIKKMQQLTEALEQLSKSVITPLKGLNDTATMLENIAIEAEKEGDIETLKIIIQKLLPLYNELDAAYSSLCDTLDATMIQKKLGERIKEQSVQFHPMPELVHIVADITANTGDYILGRSTRKLIEQGKDSNVEWNVKHVTKSVDESYIAECNQSKGIVIGGGGLFVKDTNVNQLSGWTWPCPTDLLKKIQVPIYVMGVGYNRFREQEEFAPCFIESVNTLVEKSAFFGLRNHGSIRAIQGYLRDDLKEKVRFHPCPTTVIAKMCRLPKRSSVEKYIAINCAFDRMEQRYGDKFEEVLLGMARVTKELSKDYKIKLYIQCAGDENFAKALDIVGVSYEIVTLTKALTEEEYLHYYTEPELVLAMRGHAQMIPFGCLTPVVSIISHDKLAWFLEDIEHPEWGVDVRDAKFEQKLLEKSRYMIEHREEICGQIKVAQDKLWEIMQENLKYIEI